jgi:UDP-2,4-diacetamido-2,4,6-trideoxy-beta-L-altropyranose hydrolase
MRCLTLADELREQETNISFICRGEVGGLIEFIKNKGYLVHSLPARINIGIDKKLTQGILKKQLTPSDWLIVDHYDIDITWESSLRKFAKKIMVIDDLVNRRHDCDLLLDQNYSLNKNRYQGLLTEKSVRLLGSKYALLRPQFRKARKYLRERNGEVKRILVFVGSADPSNETCKALRSIQMLNRPDITTDVVIGASNPHRNEVKTLAVKIPNTVCHFEVENMVELMTAADLSIGASGTTTWERCCVGLPSIVLALAENQIDISESLDKRGIVINLGWYENVRASDIKDAVESLIDNCNKRIMMELKGKELVDGSGAKRVVETITNMLNDDK